MVKKNIKKKKNNSIKKNKTKYILKEKINNNAFFVIVGIFLGMLILTGFLMTINPVTTGEIITGQVSNQEKRLSNDIIKIGIELKSFLTKITGALLGKEGLTNDMLFAKTLFFIIIFGLFYTVFDLTKLFENKKWTLNFVLFSISILIVRWIGSSKTIQTILLPYSTVGIALLCLIPLFVYFLIIEKGLANQPAITRRIAWMAFGVLFIGLYFSRRIEIGYFGGLFYLISAIGAGLLAWIDGTIQRIFIKINSGKVKITINKKEIEKLYEERKKYAQQLTEGIIGISEFKEVIKVIDEKIIALSKS
jgi:hypothetical protein